MSSPTCTYSIIVFGEPGVGKTCFVDQFCYGKSFVIYDPDTSVFTHEIVVNGQVSSIALMDLSTSFLKPEQGMQPIEWAKQMFAKAGGIVLLYDVTSLESFEFITDQAYKFLWDCRKLECADNNEADEEEREGFGCVLVGNRLDLVTAGKGTREVSQSLAEEWARTQGISSIEVHSLERKGPEDALKLLVTDIKKLESLEKSEAKAVEVAQEQTKGKEKRSSIRNAFKKVFNASKS